jgi:DNA mismatch endonuclease (patch repair protein)
MMPGKAHKKTRSKAAEPPVEAWRSALMGRIRGKDTKPEVKVRSRLHRAGYRFRLHVMTLPSKPDIVLPKYRAVILVHGCFWHRHQGCKAASTPGTRREFWQAKFDGNVARDARNIAELRKLGWQVYVLWECETQRGGDFWPSLERFLRRMKRNYRSRQRRSNDRNQRSPLLRK